MEIVQAVLPLKRNLLKMITVGYCKDCAPDRIKSAICEIDNKLSLLGENHYLNTIFYLNKKYSQGNVFSLMMYRDILTKKLFNNSYTVFPTDSILSKVKQLIHA